MSGDTDEMLGRMLGKLGDIELSLQRGHDEHRALSLRVHELEKWRGHADANLDAIREASQDHGARLTRIDTKLDKVVGRLFKQSDADETQNTKIAELDKTVTVLNWKQKAAIVASGLGLGNVDRIYVWIESVLKSTGKH